MPQQPSEEAEALAQAVIAAGGSLGESGDLKVEVSIVTLLLALHKSIAEMKSEWRADMDGKADRHAFDALALKVDTRASTTDLEAQGVHLRQVDTRVSALEAHKHVEEEKQAEHRKRDSQWLNVALKVTAAVWAAATSIALILATAGIFH